MFNAILIEKNDDVYQSNLTEIQDTQLPEGDVTVHVAYSTLNYKDGMIIDGLHGVVPDWPIVPGIDGAGTVLSTAERDPLAAAIEALVLSGSDEKQNLSFEPGEDVVVTGNKIGQHFGAWTWIVLVLVAAAPTAAATLATNTGTAGTATNATNADATTHRDTSPQTARSPPGSRARRGGRCAGRRRSPYHNAWRSAQRATRP